MLVDIYLHLFFIISSWGQAPALKVAYFYKIFRVKSCVAVAYKFNPKCNFQKNQNFMDFIFKYSI